jgi:hypothetical protein
LQLDGLYASGCRALLEEQVDQAQAAFDILRLVQVNVG